MDTVIVLFKIGFYVGVNLFALGYALYEMWKEKTVKDTEEIEKPKISKRKRVYVKGYMRNI